MIRIEKNKLIQSSEGIPSPKVQSEGFLWKGLLWRMPVAWEKRKHLLLNLKIAGLVIIWLASAKGIPSEKEKRFVIQNP